jgi:hypothetical protein
MPYTFALTDTFVATKRTSLMRTAHPLLPAYTVRLLTTQSIVLSTLTEPWGKNVCTAQYDGALA